MKLKAIRFPDELFDWLKQEAEKNMRSVNSEIVIRLQESKKQEERNARTE